MDSELLPDGCLPPFSSSAVFSVQQQAAFPACLETFSPSSTFFKYSHDGHAAKRRKACDDSLLIKCLSGAKRNLADSFSDHCTPPKRPRLDEQEDERQPAVDHDGDLPVASRPRRPREMIPPAVVGAPPTEHVPTEHDREDATVNPSAPTMTSAPPPVSSTVCGTSADGVTEALLEHRPEARS